MYIIYRQRQYSDFRIFLSYLVLILALILILSQFQILIFLRVFILIMIFINCLLIFFFSRLEFRIINSGLEMGFRFFKVKIKIDEIESVLIENSYDLFKGLGIRRSKDNVLCFVGKMGEGILINTKFKESFFISLNNPEEAIANLRKNKYV